MPASRELRVVEEIDCYSARRAAGEVAKEIGFDKTACAEITIAASELAFNILKYGERGALRIEVVDANDGDGARGIKLVAVDRGPPFRDFETAVKDGHEDNGPIDPAAVARRRGIGAGLGAVKRFSDALGWTPLGDGKQGKEVWMIRYVKRRRS